MPILTGFSTDKGFKIPTILVFKIVGILSVREKLCMDQITTLGYGCGLHVKSQ